MDELQVGAGTPNIAEMDPKAPGENTPEQAKPELPRKNAKIIIDVKFKSNRPPHHNEIPVSYTTVEQLQGFAISAILDIRKLGGLLIPSEGNGIRWIPLEDFDGGISVEVEDLAPALSTDLNVNAATILARARANADARLRQGNVVGFPGKK